MVMNNQKESLDEKKRILQKIKFYKRYIKHLIRIAVGSFLSTLLFVYLMDVVQIDWRSLKISSFSLIFLASLPTIIPLFVSYLLYKQLPELEEILKKLESQNSN